MPTKLNRAGNQQNYVPAGNGDASGEYGDNASGSNKHFTAFEKPKDNETKVVEQKGKGEKPEKKETSTKEQHIKSIESRFKEKNEKTKNFSNKIYENSNENISTLTKMLNENDDLKVSFGYAGRNAAGSASDYQRITMTGESVNTYRHEVGHVWDAYYGRDLEDNKDKYPMSHRICTRYIDDKENKCFDEVLHDELGIHGYNTVFKNWKLTFQKRGVDKRENKIKTVERVNSIFSDYCGEILDEKVGVKDAFKKYTELRERIRNVDTEIQKIINNDDEIKQVYKEYSDYSDITNQIEEDYANSQMEKGIYSIHFANSPEVVKAREKRKGLLEKYTDLKNSKEKEIRESAKFKLTDEEKAFIKKVDDNKDYTIYKEVGGIAGIVGDMEDYMDVHRSKYMTKGHGSNYFNQRKDDGFSCEIWANMFDCYIDKNKKNWEVLKKMFPRSTGVFERAIQKYGR